MHALPPPNWLLPGPAQLLPGPAQLLPGPAQLLPGAAQFLAGAAVLAGHSDAGHHLSAARPVVAGNPVATAILDRAAALLDGDHERLVGTAAAFEAADCPYQRARTLILAGGGTAPAGDAALAGLGLAPAAATGGPL